MELNPASAGVREALISALAYAGRTKQAFDLLDKADRTWPASASFAYTRYTLNLRFGDPSARLNIFRSLGSGTATGSAMYDPWVAFLRARLAPTPRISTGSRRLSSAKAPSRACRSPLYPGTRHLCAGRRCVCNPVQSEPLVRLRMGSEVLFRAYMKPVRDDPRFMVLSKRLGLVITGGRAGIGRTSALSRACLIIARWKQQKFRPDDAHQAQRAAREG